MPTTPRPSLNCSKRAWDGIFKAWRRQLHDYDAIEDLVPPFNYSMSDIAMSDMQSSDAAICYSTETLMETEDSGMFLPSSIW